MWLAAAYAARALLPAASTLPVPSSLVAYHVVSALWYAARADRVAMSFVGRVAWAKSSGDTVVAAKDMSAWELFFYATSSVLQFPVYCPSAAVFPFVVCCLLGMESAINSNVMLMLQTLALCVSVVFDSALVLPLYTTAVALLGFGALGHRATPIAFGAVVLGHAVFATLGAVVWAQGIGTPLHRSSLRNADVLTACFAAVMCAEARLRVATTAVHGKKRVVWACRVASVGGVLTCVFRIVAERETNTPHVATTAIAVLLLCSVWNWSAHVGWSNVAAFPPRPAQSATGLGVAFVIATTVSSATSLLHEFHK